MNRTTGRPNTRADCNHIARPCPYVGCRYHLYLDVGQNGLLLINFPNLEVDELIFSCALDVAMGGQSTHRHIGEYLNLSQERVRIIEYEARGKLASSPLSRFRHDH